MPKKRKLPYKKRKLQTQKVPTQMVVPMQIDRPVYQQVGYSNPLAAEVKYIDTVLSHTLTADPGTATLVNGCQKGSNAYNRIGTRIQMISYQLRFTIQAVADNEPQFVRCALVYHRNANASALTWEKTFHERNGGVAQPLQIAMRNLDYRSEITVLYDTGPMWLGTRGALKTSNYVDRIAICKKKHIARRMNVSFNSGDAGTIGDIQTGSVYFLTMTTVADAAALVGACRVKFTDQ